jgi:hypothetical protein
MTGYEIGGNIREFPLRDMLQMILVTKRTGSLVINGIVNGRIDFHDGRIVCAASTAPYTDIGTILMDDGIISRNQLSQAVEQQRGPQKGTMLGRVLVRLGFMNDTDLHKAMRRQVEQVVDSLLNLSEGSFDFRVSGTGADSVTQDVSEVLLEASVRRRFPVAQMA